MAVDWARMQTWKHKRGSIFHVLKTSLSWFQWEQREGGEGMQEERQGCGDKHLEVYNKLVRSG